ncbi:MAG: hypothetical protein OQJ97_01375 [Rhodospirillales bacterium]|nr:hypothetical protein [Rhodospirillales bacterium]
MDKGQQKLILAGVAILGVIVLLMNLGSSPESVEPTPAVPKFTGSIPVDADKVRQSLGIISSQKSSHSLISEGVWPSSSGYLALSFSVGGADKLVSVFASLYDQDITSITFTADVPGRSNSEPILAYTGTVAEGFSSKTSFDGLLTGFTPIQGDGPVSVDLDLTYGLKGGEEQTIPKVITLTASPEASKVVNVIKSKDGTELGHFQFELVSRPPRMVGKLSGSSLDYDAILATELDMGETLGEALREKSTALKMFWTATPEEFDKACSVLRQALTLDVGLTAADTTITLLALTSRHALFGAGISYESGCLDGETARALETLDVDFPNGDRRMTSQGSNLTQLLGKVGRLMRDSNPDNARDRLEALFADSVLIKDPHGLVGSLGNDEVFEGPGQSVLPTATPEVGAEYLLSLPVSRFACFSSGTGMNGAHRAGLIAFAGDPTIWVLDLAFGEDSRIMGVSVAQATKREICRAIATRTTPETQCYFSANGPIAPAQCR